MKFKIQLVSQCETGEAIQELACLERETEGLEYLGITLAETKGLLAILQRQVVEQQLAAYLTVRQKCPHCDQAFRQELGVRSFYSILFFPPNTPNDCMHSLYVIQKDLTLKILNQCEAREVTFR